MYAGSVIFFFSGAKLCKCPIYWVILDTFQVWSVSCVYKWGVVVLPHICPISVRYITNSFSYPVGKAKELKHQLAPVLPLNPWQEYFIAANSVELWGLFGFLLSERLLGMCLYLGLPFETVVIWPEFWT